ncbi:PIN domain-containing protein [Flammeovirga sp. MY04]|uniref:PIN domain-containing protein n=1 Tax=Flammeovirga sp. MY04 TaxID=1191459 RepID=UPI0008264F81|nr:PIN domain-containing protein [Flammeovirga sp. MY04]ANQ52719.2 PIN domain-containing protein [Flammeovirga sp. MY04]
MINCVLDANILYPVILRDLFLCLHNNNAINAFWSDYIQSEWIRNLALNRNENPNKYKIIADKMNAIFPESNIKSELIDARIDEIFLSKDLDDRHVVACALESKSNFIITYNIKDFPKKELVQLNVTAIHPDEFIYSQLDRELLHIAFEQQLKMYKKPPYDKEELLHLFDKRGLKLTSNIIKK